MRRVIAIALSLLLTLQCAAAGLHGSAPLGCACGEPAPATTSTPQSEPHCRTPEQATPGDDVAADRAPGDIGQTAAACCDRTCADCDSQLPPAPPSAIAGKEAQPPRQQPAASPPPPSLEHVPAVPLRPPSATRR